jgi:glycosyltransferase involved in cell wall biosynthesis
MYKKLTIVIPCKNEEAYIGNAIYSISKQLNSENLRVIIADANSTDNTRNIIELCKKRYTHLNIEVIDGGTVSVGRNRGAALVKTPYVLFIDADTELIEPDILIEASANLPKYKLITCKTVSAVNLLKTKLMFKSFNFLRKYLMRESFCTGVFFLTSLEDFNRYGKFDETVTNSEDYLLSKMYSLKTFKILNRSVTQDDRRFKQMGYGKFLMLLISNYFNKNKINHFRKNINYWK